MLACFSFSFLLILWLALFSSSSDSVTPDGQKKLALALDRANTSPDLFAASRADIFGDAPSLKPVAATPSSSRPSSQTGRKFWIFFLCMFSLHLPLPHRIPFPN